MLNTELNGPIVTPTYTPTPISQLHKPKNSTISMSNQHFSADVCGPQDRSYAAPEISESSTSVDKVKNSVYCAPVASSPTSSCINTPKIRITLVTDREVTPANAITPAPVVYNTHSSVESNGSVNESVNEINISDEGSVIVKRKDHSGEIKKIVLNKVKRKAEKLPAELEREDPLEDIKKAKPIGKEINLA